jgi:tRNA-dihydrouridine synthase B
MTKNAIPDPVAATSPHSVQPVDTVRIGSVPLPSPCAIAPMAGMTDSAFRRLVKRHGGCGLVVTEMVSSEGLVRGIDRTLEYAEYTEEERPIAIQIFGGDPDKMAEAARIVEGLGADIVDVNMGCPVPKIAKHNAGCSLMREPAHAASVVRAMTRSVRIPVTVKMRAGWNEREINAPDLARRIEDAGAAAVTVHGRTAAQSYSGFSDWDLIGRVAEDLTIPVFGSGDCVEPEQIVERLRDSRVGGVLVGRGVLRNPWILAQAAALASGRPVVPASPRHRAAFLLEYIDLLLGEGVGEAEGFRHKAGHQARDGGTFVGPGIYGPANPSPPQAARGRERWVINKIRALAAWYTRGFENGSKLRTAVNACESVDALRELVHEFFDAAHRANESLCPPSHTGARGAA